jgi:GTP:adenosylcobinamide-phosphate guanylyltransferase
MHAIVLAGGGRSDSFAEKHGAVNKALIPINGRPMFEYVFEAIKESRHVEDIVIVGPKQHFGKYQDSRVSVLDDVGDMTENCLNGVRSLPHDGKRVVLVTSDIPLLTTEIIDGYLDIVAGMDGQFLYPLISREVNEESYPGGKRTYGTLKEGVFTGGNVMVIDPAIAEPIAGTVRRLVAQRKSVLAMGALVGLPVLFKLITRQLTIAEAERRVSHILNCKCVVVRCPYAAIGTDVDKDSDLELVRTVMARS